MNLMKKIYDDVEEKWGYDMGPVLFNAEYRNIHEKVRHGVYDVLDAANIAGHFGDVFLFIIEYKYE